DVALAVGHHGFERRAHADFRAADHARDLDALGLHLGQPALELGPFRRAGCVREDGLVDGRRELEDAVRAHGAILVPDGSAAVRAGSRMGAVPVTEVAYDVDGWGTGLLWFADDVLVWHELPSTGETAGLPRELTSAAGLIERLLRYFSGEPVGFEDVPVDLDWCTPFQRAVADTLR